MLERLTEMPTIRLVHKGLDTASKRHAVISNNIANVNTPGFKRQFVNFEEEMARAYYATSDLKGIRTDDRHFPINDHSGMEINPTVIRDKTHVMRNDKNNIDIDMEMGDLAKNTMNYQIFTNRVNFMFTQLNDIITRGGRA